MAGKGADHGSGLTEYRIWVQINKLFCERFDPSGITGNITGFTTDNSTQGGKWVELLKQIDPYTARMTLLRKATTKNEHVACPRSGTESLSRQALWPKIRSAVNSASGSIPARQPAIGSMQRRACPSQPRHPKVRISST